MKKTYNIITIGCQMNMADSERIAAYLESYGFKKEPDRNKAGLVVLNTCGIRQTAEDRNYGLIPDIKNANPKVKIVLTGCLSERKDVRRRLDEWVDIWLPIKSLPSLYRELGLKEKVSDKELGRLEAGYLGIAPKTASPFSVFIPIGNGCDNFCSYCVVPFARGRESYRQAGEIVREAEDFIKKGYKEITLIAQNVNSYEAAASRKDLKYFPNKKVGEAISFAELLDAVGNLPGNYWVRFATSHPKNMSADLIRVVARGGRFCPYVHLPVQAGDDRILATMNRKYTAEHYLKLIKKIKKAIPDVGLSTDIIVGFPGETKKQFQNTAKLMKEVKYSMAYTACYSPRPGTAAAKMSDDVAPAEKRRRAGILENILKKTAAENNERFLDREVVVLAEEKNKKGEWHGKNGQNVTVKILGAADKDLAGRFVLVKITKTKDFGLTGNFIK